jgi:hypothetical protein
MPITAPNHNKSPNFVKALFLNVIKTMMFVDHRRTCPPFGSVQRIMNTFPILNAFMC